MGKRKKSDVLLFCSGRGYLRPFINNTGKKKMQQQEKQSNVNVIGVRAAWTWTNLKSRTISYKRLYQTNLMQARLSSSWALKDQRMTHITQPRKETSGATSSAGISGRKHTNLGIHHHQCHRAQPCSPQSARCRRCHHPGRAALPAFPSKQEIKQGQGNGESPGWGKPSHGSHPSGGKHLGTAAAWLLPSLHTDHPGAGNLIYLGF